MLTASDLMREAARRYAPVRTRYAQRMAYRLRHAARELDCKIGITVR